MGNFKFNSAFLSPSQKPPRNGFDMSRKEPYSLPFGVITPVSFEKVIPGEHYNVNVGSYVQTNNMRNDHFTDIYNHMKAVFVPMSSLKRNYLQFTTSVDGDRLRKDLSIPQIYYQPCVGVHTLYYMFFPSYFVNYLLQNAVSMTTDILDYAVTYANGGISVYDGLGQSVSLNDFQSSNPFAYQLALIYQQSEQRYPLYRKLYNSLKRLSSRSGEFFVFDALRLLDHLGYGNFWPIYNDLCATVMRGLELGTLSTIQNITDLITIDSNLFDPTEDYFDLVYSDTGFPNLLGTETDLSSNTTLLNLEKIVAFQYYVSCCEQSSYRNPQTFVFTLDFFSAFINNVTNIYQSPYSNDIIKISPSAVLTTSQFASTDALVGLLRDSASLQRLSNQSRSYSSVLLYLFSLSNPLLRQDLYSSAQLSTVSGTSPSDTDLSVEKMNEVSALYKLRQNLLRAGVRAKDYMQAFFGQSGNDHIIEPVTILDDTRNNVTITGLINQAASTVADLGERAAKGNGGSSLSFSFDSNDYGYIFYVQYFTCDVYYENNMIERDNVSVPALEYNPVNANLGLSPLYSQDVTISKKEGDLWKNVPANTVVGFSSRDWFLKNKNNLIHGFFTNVPLNYQSSNYSNIDSIQDLPTLSRGNAPRGGFVVSLYNQQFDLFATIGSLKFTPDMLNGVFNQMHDSVLFSNSVFDQFAIITNFNVRKVSPQSVLGLPKLI